MWKKVAAYMPEFTVDEGQLETGVLGQAPGRVSESRAWQNLKQSEREREGEHKLWGT